MAVFAVCVRYARFSRQINKQVWAALAESSNLATQAISNIRTVRAFGTEEFEDGLYKEATQEALDKSILDAKASSLSYTLTSYLDLGTTVLLLWYGGLVVMNREGNPDDPLTVGKLITFQLYWNMMNSAYSTSSTTQHTPASSPHIIRSTHTLPSPLLLLCSLSSLLSADNLNSLINQFTKAAAAAQKVMMLSDTLPDITTKHTAKTDDSTNLQGQIDVNHLSFYYQMRPEHTVLKDVNLHIPPASTCAFVGRSGGGKSTLVHLLLRFYDAKQGSVSFDGVNIDEWNLPVLRKQMAVVQQGSDLFATSIIENITYGMQPHEWTRQEVIDAAKAANCYDFIMDMEEGFDTRVGERGQRISGGQKQRIAICRALLRKPKVLLLDEATSALDAESESQVQLAIDNLIKLTHCTVLLVAHRLSTVMNADQICVLDGGTIIERGTHEQLLEQGGLYYELVKRQLARKANLLEDGEEEEGGGTAGRGGGGKAADSIDVLIAQTARQRTMKDKDERKGERKEP